jgi:xanthine dehydrogenase YagR molybdenum-binding subunit
MGVVCMKLVKTTVTMEGRTYEEYAVIEEGNELAPWGPNEELGIVGYPTARVDGAARVSGEARYTYDVRLPGMAYTRALLSPHPHARLVSVDATRARALSGVLAVVTRPEAAMQVTEGERWRFSDELRYAGDIVAVVAASDPDIAEDALDLIDVAYEVLPFVTDADVALNPGAPQATEEPSNIFGGKVSRADRGDIDAGLAEAEVLIDQTYRTQTTPHSCLEAHGSVAQWEGDVLTLYESTQHVFGVRKQIARGLGIDESRVRVICNYMGGGFGSKGGASITAFYAPLLAKAARRPVQFMLDRAAEQIGAGNRCSTVQHITIGARRDGTLTAIQYRTTSDLGATPGWLPFFAGQAMMLYRCPNVAAETTGILTNNGAFDAFRAPGFVEGAFAFESALDELAVALGLDPIELRRRNLPDIDQTNGHKFSSFPMEECWRRGSAAIGWPSTGAGSGTRRQGKGVAGQIWWGGGGPPAYAQIDLNSDGTATLRTGTQDIGTGTKTVLTQVAAEELGFPMAAIRTTVGDTGSAPYAPVSGGSMTVPSMAPAVRSAAQDARRQLVSLAAQMLDVPEGELEVRGGSFYHRDVQKATVREMLGKLGDTMISGKGSRGPNPSDYSIITSGAQFAEVEVDTVTGRVRVLRVVAAHDVGREINPLTLRSQIEGGITQALGFSITENRVIDHRSGLVLNPDLEGYKLPTIADMPVIDTLRIDIPDLNANPTGAKGAGEPPIIPTAAAIANAVYNAIGVRIRDLPITPDKVLDALRNKA